MPRTKLEEIIKSSDIEEFSQFFRLKTRAEGNFRPSNERLSQYDDADFFDFAKLGQIEFSESQRLLVASARVDRDLSERSGKKAQYEKAKKMLRELSAYSAGIFIFYDKGGGFRFSLVYPESVGTRREWSNFRRFTYFVSKELTNKTFLQRIGDGNFSTLEKVKDAFSVEKVTKEFYLEYRKLFDGLMENLSKNHTFTNEASKNNINTENFSKKLLGQIVFLYFIQKKGWIGVPAGKKWGEGDKNFMGNIYKEAMAKGVNFYNDYLEKLFYNALNNSHRDSADPSFSKDFNSRIPFLNGGLFEAEYDWKNSLMYLDNKIFQSIFDVFERYNFTVEEESPDDKEIAVDPEMLGKVFENLLPENLRKGKGTYYTPREIVYYMCRESLVNYLVSNHSNITEENIRNYIFYSESFENFKKQKGESFTPGQWKELDDLLVNIKVCDPACGSGAFLVGMLNMIVKLRIFLQTTPDSHLIPQKKEYELKREAIQNCIYGVDIDPGAIEIAKLRLWLALVVDYGLEDIEPLPNLDYRLMCGNSLLEEFEGIKFYNGEGETQATLLPLDPEKQKKIEALKKKVKEYFSIHDDKEKLKKRKEINDIKDWLIGTALERRHRDITALHKSEQVKANMLDEKSRKQYLGGFSKWLGSSANIQQALESLHNPKKEKPFFIWKLEFIDVFEEKGGFDVVIANPPYNAQLSKEESILFKNKYESVKTGRQDTAAIFVERAKQIGNQNMQFAYILPYRLFSRKRNHGQFQIYTLLNFSIKNIIYLGTDVDFSANDEFMILIMSSEHIDDNKILVAFKPALNLLDRKDIYREISQQDFVNRKEVNLNLVKNDLSLIKKIEGATVLLGTICEVKDGIVPYIREKLIADIKIDERYVKFAGIAGKYILQKYLFSCEPLYLCYDMNEAKKFIKDKVELRKVQLRERDIFLHRKIVSSQNSSVLKGAIDENKTFVSNSIHSIYLKNEYVGKYALEYILALFNSNLMNYYHNFLRLKATDLHPQILVNDLKKLPIFLVPKNQQNKFFEIVNKILAITKDDDYLENSAKQAKVRDYEKQIDQLVYKLYGLTPEEIKIVESK